MFKKINLDNGLRIILAPQKEGMAVTVSVLVEAGSDYESKEINGISHFLEHMVFKGTAKRPTTLDISSELDSIGAIYNAFTSSEYTGYFAKARANHFEKILDILSDMYLNPLFDPAEIEKEKGVIIEEINLSEDQPMRRVWDVLGELMYGNQPAGRRTLGTKENIQKMARDNFLAYWKERYLPQSTVVVVAGGFDESRVVEEIKKHFGGMPAGEKIEKVKTFEKQDRPAVSVKFKDSDQSHLVLGFRAFDLFDERKYSLGILGDILGGGMSSRLFQKIREEMGAAYYVRAGSDLSADHGYFAVSAGAGNNKLNPVIEAIMGELKKITIEPVSEKELSQAKEHIIGNTILELETSDQLAGFYGEQEIAGREIKTPEEIIKKIEAVSAEDILAVAKEIFKNEKMNLALIGPFKESEPFEKLLQL